MVDANAQLNPVSMHICAPEDYLARHVGVEVEVESNRLDITSVEELIDQHQLPYTRVSEGSLRAGTMGWEVKTSGNDGQPAATVYQHLRGLAQLLHGSTGIWRAAIHCHVDCRDFDEVATSKLLSVLYCFDEHLFDRHSPHRIESNFCVPLRNVAPTVHSSITSMRNGTHPRHLRWNKYTSCNMHALNTFGTVEFRHMQTPAGATQAEAELAAVDVWNFVEDCVSLVSLVYQLRELPLAQLFDSVEWYMGVRLDPEKKYESLVASRAQIRTTPVLEPSYEERGGTLSDRIRNSTPDALRERIRNGPPNVPFVRRDGPPNVPVNMAIRLYNRTGVYNLREDESSLLTSGSAARQAVLRIFENYRSPV